MPVGAGDPSGDGAAAGKSVAVIGVGNIGSALVPHLGRLPGIGRVLIVDGDRYESANLGTQEILPSDVGRPKALAQRDRLHRINPRLQVSAIADLVENVPLGLLRADVIVACLDSRQARRSVNHIATRLGVAWIDAGVEGGGLLARLNVYLPGGDHACMECSWCDEDYAALERRYSCPGNDGKASAGAGDGEGADRPPATGAPSSLGALAAALQAIELQKLLARQYDRAAIDREVLIDAAWHRHFVTESRRDSRCRFDHLVWQIARLDRGAAALTLADAFALAPSPAVLRLGVQQFAVRLCCPGCGRTVRALRVASRPSRRRRCAGCGGALAPRGFDLVDRIEPSELSRSLLGRSLARLGLRGGDVFTLEGDFGALHFEIAQLGA